MAESILWVIGVIVWEDRLASQNPQSTQTTEPAAVVADRSEPELLHIGPYSRFPKRDALASR